MGILFILLSLKISAQSYLKTDLLEYIPGVTSINLDYEIVIDSLRFHEFGIRYDIQKAGETIENSEIPVIEMTGFPNFGINYGRYKRLDRSLFGGVELSYQYHQIKRSNWSCDSLEMIGNVFRCFGLGPQSNIQKTHSFFVQPRLLLQTELTSNLSLEFDFGLLVGYHISSFEGEEFSYIPANEELYEHGDFFGEQILNSDLQGLLVTPKIGIKFRFQIRP